MTSQPQRYTIARIRSRRESGSDLVVTFSNGMEATFSKEDSAYALCVQHASPDGDDSPVGLVIEPHGRIVSVTGTMKARPGRLGKEIRVPRALQGSPRYEGYYLLGLSGPAGVYRLAPDHPEFDRIVATLESARAQDREVWISLLPDLLVLDVRMADAIAPAVPSAG